MVEEVPQLGTLLTSAGRQNVRIRQVVEMARRHLQMELAFVSQVSGDRQIYRATDGDAASFGISEGSSSALIDTYCRLMLEQRISNEIPDASSNRLLTCVPGTAARRIGAYIGVPLQLRNGATYGTLCCLAHDPQDLDSRDVGFLLMLAEVIADDLQAEQDTEQNRQRIGGLIDQDLIETAFQPIVSLDDGRRLGLEALSRFPTGFGPPDHTFKLAHEIGRGTDLEAKAIRGALRGFATLPMDQFLSVNVTPDAVIDLVRRRSSRHDMYARLVIEITEHAIVHDYPRLRISLQTLRAEGIRLAVDDAGSGWASLHHIIELDPDIIKIDRSIVHGLPEDRSRRSVVRAFMSIAADISATVIAEGVETEQELDAIRSLGVHAAQGFYLGRPIPIP